MRLGIISDIHENFHNLFLALEAMDALDVEIIYCLGDLMNPGIAKILAAQATPTHLIWGNNDGERVDITKTAMETGSSLSVANSTYDFVKPDGVNIFLTHYFDLADPMAKSGLFSAVFYGHDHIKTMRRINNCLVLNPGELAASKTGVASFAWYDTSTGEAQIVDLAGSVTLKTEYADEKLEKYMNRFTSRSQSAFRKS